MQGFQQRSAIPKVMGILMIIFASLGLLATMRNLFGSSLPEGVVLPPELRSYRTMELLVTLIGLGVGGLHLLAGIRAVAYRTIAPKLATAYATIAIISTLLASTVTYVYLRPMLGMMVGDDAAGIIGPTMILTSLVSLTWPVLVLILMTRPTARAACVVEPAGPVRLSIR